MKKTRFFGVISTLVLLIAVFAIFANVEERSAKYAEADVDGALYGASGIVVPEVIVNPPTDLVNNSAELSDAIDVVFSNGSSSEYVIVYNSAGSFSSDLSNLFYKNGKSDVLFF